MKVLRWLAIGFGVLIVGLVCTAVAARFADGGIGPFPGGPLVAGRLIDAPVRDWSFVDPVREIQLQLVVPPRSRTTWILLHEGGAYIPCGLPNLRLWKKWPHEALEDGRALVRIEGKRYGVELVRINDDGLRRELARALETKYSVDRQYAERVWFFKLDARG